MSHCLLATSMIQVTNLGFSLPWHVGYSQSSSSTTLTVVRPLAHATHPIPATGPAQVIFGTGPSSSKAAIGTHGSNKGVGAQTRRVGHASSPMMLSEVLFPAAEAHL